MTRRIQVAGTSVGGSSYTRRMMRLILEAKGDESCEVLVTRGEKQVEVYQAVNNQLIELYEFVSSFDGMPKFNIQIKME